MLLNTQTQLTEETIEDMLNIKMLHPLIPSGSLTMIAANAGNLKTSAVINISSYILEKQANMETYWFDYDQGVHRAKGLKDINNTGRFAAIPVNDNQANIDVFGMFDKLMKLEVQ